MPGLTSVSPSVVYRAKACHDKRTVALKKVQIFEMTDSKARLDCMKVVITYFFMLPLSS